MTEKKEKDEKIFLIRMPIKMHALLRKMAYLTEQPMASLVRTAIEKEIAIQKKMLTNSDIAI